MYKIIPKEGTVTIDPVSLKRLPKDGKIFKSLTTFWKNRLKDGDISIEDMSKKEKKGK